MIREIARLQIDPDRAEDFLAAVARAAPLFHAARGCRSMRIERVIENPAIFLLLVDWETLDDHMTEFRNQSTTALAKLQLTSGNAAAAQVASR